MKLKALAVLFVLLLGQPTWAQGTPTPGGPAVDSLQQVQDQVDDLTRSIPPVERPPAPASSGG